MTEYKNAPVLKEVGAASFMIELPGEGEMVDEVWFGGKGAAEPFVSIIFVDRGLWYEVESRLGEVSIGGPTIVRAAQTREGLKQMSGFWVDSRSGREDERVDRAQRVALGKLKSLTEGGERREEWVMKTGKSPSADSYVDRAVWKLEYQLGGGNG